MKRFNVGDTVVASEEYGGARGTVAELHGNYVIVDREDGQTSIFHSEDLEPIEDVKEGEGILDQDYEDETAMEQENTAGMELEEDVSMTADDIVQKPDVVDKLTDKDVDIKLTDDNGQEITESKKTKKTAMKKKPTAKKAEPKQISEAEKTAALIKMIEKMTGKRVNLQEIGRNDPIMMRMRANKDQRSAAANQMPPTPAKPAGKGGKPKYETLPADQFNQIQGQPGSYKDSAAYKELSDFYAGYGITPEEAEANPEIHDGRGVPVFESAKKPKKQLKEYDSLDYENEHPKIKQAISSLKATIEQFNQTISPDKYSAISQVQSTPSPMCDDFLEQMGNTWDELELLEWAQAYSDNKKSLLQNINTLNKFIKGLLGNSVMESAKKTKALIEMIEKKSGKKVSFKKEDKKKG